MPVLLYTIFTHTIDSLIFYTVYAHMLLKKYSVLADPSTFRAMEIAVDTHALVSNINPLLIPHE